MKIQHFNLATVAGLCLITLACSSSLINATDSSVKESRMRLNNGDINAAVDFCRIVAEQNLALNSSDKYADLCARKNESYANNVIYQKYQAMLKPDRSVNRADTQIANKFWSKTQKKISDKATIETVDTFLKSANKSVSEYRVFEQTRQDGLTNVGGGSSWQHYRAHAFIVLRNPELSGSAVWLKKAKHPAIFNVDGTRPVVVERWYAENGSYHRAIANDEGRLIGSVTLDPNREQQVFLFDINGDRIVDISATIRGDQETIMVKPDAMYFLDQWRAGSNLLCGRTGTGGPIGTDELSTVIGGLNGSPQPPVISGCSLSPRGGGGMSSLPKDLSIDSSPCSALESLAGNTPSPGQGFMSSVCKSYGHPFGGTSGLVADQTNGGPCYGGCPGTHQVHPGRSRASDSLDIFDENFEEMTEEESREWIDTQRSESTPISSEDTGMSGSCSGGICDTNGDGTADAYDSDNDGAADASCDPCSTNEESSSTSEPVSPDENNSFAGYCANLGANYRQSILDTCRAQEVTDTDCDDPFINPDPRMRGVASLSSTEASTVSGGDKVDGLTCAEAPGRVGVVEPNCPEGNPLADPISPDHPVPCLSLGNGSGGNVSLDVMFGSALAFEFCDERLCTSPEELSRLGAAAKLRTDRL